MARHTSYFEEGENSEGENSKGENSKGENTVTASQSFTYFSYGEDNIRRENTADLQLSITIEKDIADENKLHFTYSWVIVVNGKELHRGDMKRENSMDNEETLRENTVVYQDDFLQFRVKYYIIRFSTELTVEGNFLKLTLDQ